MFRSRKEFGSALSDTLPNFLANAYFTTYPIGDGRFPNPNEWVIEYDSPRILENTYRSQSPTQVLFPPLYIDSEITIPFKYTTATDPNVSVCDVDVIDDIRGCRWYCIPKGNENTSSVCNIVCETRELAAYIVSFFDYTVAQWQKTEQFPTNFQLLSTIYGLLTNHNNLSASHRILCKQFVSRLMIDEINASPALSAKYTNDAPNARAV